MAEVGIFVGTMYGNSLLVAEEAEAILSGLGHKATVYEDPQVNDWESYTSVKRPISPPLIRCLPSICRSANWSSRSAGGYRASPPRSPSTTTARVKQMPAFHSLPIALPHANGQIDTLLLQVNHRQAGQQAHRDLRMPRLKARQPRHSVTAETWIVFRYFSCSLVSSVSSKIRLSPTIPFSGVRSS